MIRSNPLGRVLAVGEEHMNKDIETLELRLAEAIMAERPAIERGIPVVKIISVVAPSGRFIGNGYRYDRYLPANYTIWYW